MVEVSYYPIRCGRDYFTVKDIFVDILNYEHLKHENEKPDSSKSNVRTVEAKYLNL